MQSSYLFSALWAVLLAPLASTVTAATDGNTVATNYQQHCAACHGAQRLGGTGPALLPQNLSRLRNSAATEVISEGRALTQMPAFGKLMTAEEIEQLTDYIYQPPDATPKWELEDIRNTHIVHHAAGTLDDQPVFDADLQNLFIVVELGDHHATVLDGDTFEPIHRFKTRFALHGGPKYSSDGRYVYFASRDGWITKYDLYKLKVVAEVRAGINTRNAAVSFNNKYVAVGNYLPNNLVLLSAEDLSPIAVLPMEDDQGKTSRVSAVYTAPPRNSFIVALKDIPEIREIPYDSIEAGKPVPMRKIVMTDFLDDFFFNQEYSVVMGAARPTGSGAKTEGVSGKVIDLDTGKKIADLAIPGMPHLGSGISWEYEGRTVMATPNLNAGEVSVIDMDSWEVLETLETEGPGFFMRSHNQSPYAWVDVFFGPNKDKVHVFDKKTLALVKTLRPVPGKTAAHVEFTKDGKYALLSIWDKDGAVIVYDATTLEEIKRLPMSKPSGKYNVYNKTHYEAGTSH
ncbi:MAG: cytochrome D1 domain-containing protein [Halioglobus sp.]